jgi:hypothetical protein
MKDNKARIPFFYQGEALASLSAGWPKRGHSLESAAEELRIQ